MYQGEICWKCLSRGEISKGDLSEGGGMVSLGGFCRGGIFREPLSAMSIKWNKVSDIHFKMSFSSVKSLVVMWNDGVEPFYPVPQQTEDCCHCH